MAPGHKRMRIPFRDRIPKNPSIHKKLEFLDEAAQMKHDCVSTPVIQKEDEFTEIDWLSPCHTRSGTVYEPDETLTLSDIKRKDLDPAVALLLIPYPGKLFDAHCKERQ